MNYTYNIQNQTGIFQLQGPFTFSDNQKFRDILVLMENERLDSVIMDFTEAEFIDSSALGMLLVLHDKAKKMEIPVTLQHPGGQIRKMFLQARFDTLFKIAV